MPKKWAVTLVSLVVVVAAAGVWLLAAGSGSGDPAVPVEAIQLAAENTQAAESMQFELHSTGTLGVSASGVVSGDGQQGKVSVEIGSLGSLEERIVDGTIYVGGGELLSRVLGTGQSSWIAISPGDGPGALGSSALGDLGHDPTSALDVLNRVAGPVETVGDDTVAGQHATHYRVSIDAEGSSTSVDVWIDDHDRVVKVTSSEPNGGDVTFEVTAFGVPVDVQAPPADQVTTLPDLSSVLGNLGKNVGSPI